MTERPNVGDIDPIVVALSDPAAYRQQFPNCNYLLGDINGAGAVNFADIDLCRALLGGG